MKIPRAVVLEVSKYREHVNGYNLIFGEEILERDDLIDIKHLLV